jgi:hypothetical protein
MPPTHSYQHALIDPTARFAMIRPPVRPAMINGCPSNGHDNPGEKQQPSDLNQVNGDSSPSLMTTGEGECLKTNTLISEAP